MHMLLPLIARVAGDFDQLWALLNYFAVCLTDGDYLNDWLTHLPIDVNHALQVVGHFLVNLT